MRSAVFEYEYEYEYDYEHGHKHEHGHELVVGKDCLEPFMTGS